MSDNKKTSNNYGDAFNVEVPSFGDQNEETRFIGDFDAFLKSMGITPTETTDSSASSSEIDDIPDFTAGEVAPRTQATQPKPKRTKKPKTNSDEQEYVAYAQNEEAVRNSSKERQEFLHRFRVLDEDAVADSSLYESDNAETKGANFADSLDTEDGDDIFEAVDRAGTSVKGEEGVFTAEGESVSSIKKKAKKKKQEKLLLSAKAMRKKLAKSLKLQRVQLAALFALCFITLILSVLPKLYTKDNPLEFMFQNGALVYGIINLSCLVFAFAAAFDRMISAFKSFRKGSPNSDTALFVVFLFVLIHNIYTVSAGICGSSSGVLFNIYAVVAITVSVISENLKCKMAYKNISRFSKITSLDTIHPVEDVSDSEVLGKGVTKKGKEKLLYCARANTIDSLSDDMGARSFDGKFYSIAYMAILMASVFCGVLTYLRGTELSSFFTALVSCACLCGPNICEISRTILFYNKNKQFSAEGAAVLNFDGVEKIGKSNALVMDVSDLFTVEVKGFRKTAVSRVSRNEAAVLTVSALKGAKSLIYSAFDDFEKSLSELPAAEFSQVVSGAGYVSKVLGRQVLVGNRNLLTKYKIVPPSQAEEKKYGKGNIVFYVVVDGVISATFIVDYLVTEATKRASASFNKTGMLLLITSREPMINEKFVSAKLNIDVSAIKILGKDASSLMDEYRLNRSMRVGSGLVCNSKQKNAFLLASLAHRLFDSDRMLLGLNVALQLTFFLLLIVAVFINVSSLMNPFVILLIHAVCFAACTGLAIIKK